MNKFARNSDGEPYECQKEWDCFVQCGSAGVVFTQTQQPDGSYAYDTAFFEAFPNNPDTFIRGEGKTITEAEESAWRQFVKFSACTNHEYERKGYDNGAGFCKHCGMFKSKAFRPIQYPCEICRQPTSFFHGKNSKIYCADDWMKIPESDRDFHFRFYIEHPESMEDYRQKYLAEQAHWDEVESATL